MATVSSMAELEALIKGAVEEGLKDVGEKGVEVVEKSIKSTVHDAYSPKVYGRTHQLEDSLTHEMVGDMEVEIKHQGVGGYNSIVDGYSANPSLMSELIHNSGSHDLWGNGGAFTSPRPYMDNALDSVESKASEVLKASLSSKGFNVG